MFTMLKDFDTDITVSLESQMGRLALESGVLSNVIETFKHTVPALAQHLFEGYKGLTIGEDLQPHTQQVKLEFGKLKVKLAHANFVNAADVLISVPEGFKGDLLAYSQSLGAISGDIFREANQILGEYNFALSAFITNKDHQISLKDHTAVFLRVKAARETFAAEIGKYFDPDSNLSKLKLKQVVNRFGDLDDLVKGVDKLNVQRKSQNVKDISMAVKKSLDMLDLILKSAQEKGMTNISPNAAMNISTGAYEIGKYVEFIAVYRFRVEQLVSTIEKLMTQIDESI